MTVPLVLIRNDDQSAHASPGHPERPDRVFAILEGIAADDELAALPWLDTPAGRRDLPLLVHSEDEVRKVEGLAVRGGFQGGQTAKARSGRRVQSLRK